MSEQSPMVRFAARIESWPRVLRIILTLVITVFVVLLIWMALAELVGGGILNLDPNPALTLIVILMGLFIYGACWASLVGFENQEGRTWHAGLSAVYFLLAGLVSLILVVLIGVVVVT